VAAGSKTCGTAPGRDAAGCCGIFLFLPPSCAVPILVDEAMSRVRWRTERREACPGRGPTRITLRVLRRKKKRRSNRPPRAAARGRPPPCAPLPWLAVRGRSTRPATGARPHTARPVKDHLTYRGAQRPARGGGARCPHTERQPTPAPHPARACAAWPRYAQGLRPWSASTEVRLARPMALAGGQTAVAVLLVRTARPDLDAGALGHYIAKPCTEERKPAEGQTQTERPSSPWQADVSVRGRSGGAATTSLQA
jgi:hypothetical protein